MLNAVPYNSYDIKEVVKVWVESDFFDSDDEEIKIHNYTLTRLTEQAFDL